MKLVADLHTHSVASGHAYSTIQEMAAEARNKGLAILTITDHGPTMPGGPHIYHFGNLRVVNSGLIATNRSSHVKSHRN